MVSALKKPFRNIWMPGVYRVILGTAAITQPDFLENMVAKYGEKIAVGVDIKDGMDCY